MSDGLLEAIEAVGEKSDLYCDAVLVNGEVRAVLFAKQVNAGNNSVFVYLAVDITLYSVFVCCYRRHEGEFKLPLCLSGKVEPCISDDCVQRLEVFPDLATTVTGLECHSDGVSNAKLGVQPSAFNRSISNGATKGPVLKGL